MQNVAFAMKTDFGLGPDHLELISVTRRPGYLEVAARQDRGRGKGWFCCTVSLVSRCAGSAFPSHSPSACQAAVEAGVRLIDCANDYGNEGELRRSKLCIPSLLILPTFLPSCPSLLFVMVAAQPCALLLGSCMKFKSGNKCNKCK